MANDLISRSQACEMLLQQKQLTPSVVRRVLMQVPTQEAEKNEPLSLDELRKMRYGWVWVISDDPDLTVSGWAYVCETGAITIWEYKPDSIVGNVRFEWEDYGKTWLAYRHPPKEEADEQDEN